ncbi:MAG TPA: tetratricopeptide repeat protein [Longimicrobiales bacterium]
MKSITKLKDEARRYEQREEWEKAIQTYLQVLRIADEGETEVELPLYNRLGDLCVRLGRPQEAMRHYEQAADRYAEAGLYNNAIALCNKALRYSPDRLELIRKLGQFSASQGFITDARRYFLDYAERQLRAGKVGDALKALEDFANVSDDPEIREMLGRQLHAHGRTNDALDELRRAHAMRVSAGETELAEALRQEILSIDPRAAVEGGAAAAPAPRARDAAAELPGLVEIETPEPESRDIPPPAPAGIESLETGGPAGAEAGGLDVTGYEPGGEPLLEDITAEDLGDIEGLERGAFDDTALSDFSIERQESPFGDALGRDAETFDLAAPDVTKLPGLDDTEDSTFDLPLLGDDDDEEATPLRTVEMDSMPPAGPSEPPLDPLAGDLRIDLNALGFTFPPTAPETPAAEPEPTPEEMAPAVDEPAIPADPEAQELPYLETEAAPAAEAPVEAPPPIDGTEAEVVEVPAIELPTWDLSPVVEPEEQEAEPYEAAWIDASVTEEEETVAELPTFEYEDEDVAPTEVIGEDEDPLGLAEHLGGSAPPPIAPDREPPPARKPRPPVTPAAPPANETPPAIELPDEPVPDTDWLDDVAGDEERAPWEAPAADAALDGKDVPETDRPEAIVEDVPAELDHAQESAREMSQPPSAGFVDLGALITDDDEKGTTRFRVRETAPTGDEDRDFAELLSQFKSKVQEHLPPEDAAAHYDLGLAFKEMGLIDEAIGEFQVALRAGHMRLKVYEELGQCFLQKEQYNIAEKVLSRALQMKFDDELELLGVYYHLGRAYEALGRREQARDAYERVLGMDINFEDVTARLARL